MTPLSSSGPRVAVAGFPGKVDNFMVWPPFQSLARALAEIGGSLTRLDLPASTGDAIDIAIFMEIPKRPVEKLLAACPGVEPWVVLWENEVVAPRNWDLGKHNQFAQIFTWNDALVDGRRYHKLAYPYEGLRSPTAGVGDQAGFCTLVAANKVAYHPHEIVRCAGTSYSLVRASLP